MSKWKLMYDYHEDSGNYRELQQKNKNMEYAVKRFKMFHLQGKLSVSL